MGQDREDGRRNVVIVAAHPDDVAHAMGGTAYLMKDRYKLHVLCLTRGERGLSREPSPETAAIRTKEEEAACAILGADLTFLAQTDGEVFAGRELGEKGAAILKELDPVAVFTMWPINVRDHSAAYEIAMKALHLAGTFYTTEFYMFENGIGGQTNQFEPDVYVNISEVVERKKDLVRCHACQNPDEDSVNRVIQRNVFRGLLARCDYAEPFKTFMPLMGSRWGRRSGCILLDL